MFRKKKQRSFFNYASLISLLVVASIVVFEAVAELRGVERREHQAVAQSIDLASERLSAYFQLLRSRVTVASHQEIDRIRAIFEQGQGYEAADRLEERVVSRLPNAFAATVAGTNGNPLVPDFDGLVAKICVDNIRHFARTGGDYQIRVHPNPFGYHFDVMVPVHDHRAGHEGIFFVSFHLQRIAEILKASQLPGHQLMLLFEPEGDLIEVHPQGGRNALERPRRLTVAEQERVMGARAVSGTMWRIVDLPSQGLLQAKSYAAVSRYSGYLLLLVLMAGLVVVSIRREGLYLRTLEEANDELETRVDARTGELQAANERIGAIIENTSDAIVSIDSNQTIRLFNAGAEQMFGYRASEVIGRPLDTLLPPEYREGHAGKVEGFGREQKQARPKDSRSEIYGLRKDGTVFAAEATICKMEVDGQSQYTAFVRDVTERKAEEERIRELAMQDPLTGVANRRHLESKLPEAIAYAARYGHKVGLLVLDLDDFKPVNDNYGHQVGDAVLQNVAALIQENLREVDVVGRFGGDEFAAVITGVEHTEAMASVAEKLLARVSAPQRFEQGEIQVGASIGIAVYPEHGTDPDTLFACADKALYAAKAEGKNAYRVYAPAVEQ